MALAPAHAFELHAVGIEEEHGVIVVVILAGGIDDGRAALLEIRLERVDIFPVPQTERVVVKADVAFAVFVFLALFVRGGDPEQRLAVGPTHHALVFGLDAEAEEFHQRRIELLRLLEIADADDEMVHSNDFDHGFLL
jgi:hypothetical protein